MAVLMDVGAAGISGTQEFKNSGIQEFRTRRRHVHRHHHSRHRPRHRVVAAVLMAVVVDAAAAGIREFKSSGTQES